MPCRRGQGGQLFLARAPHLAGFGKSGGVDDAGVDAARAAAVDPVEHGLLWHHDARQVGHLGQVGDAGPRLQPGDLLLAGVDRVDAPLVAVPHQTVQRPAAGLLRVR